jgi:dihydroxyacetone kinase-like protein
MTQSFKNREGAAIVTDIIKAVQDNKVYLSEIDGMIGDGDHGINMNKGFSMAGEAITPENSFSEAAKILGDTLLLEIGGSMGPIYGTLFRAFWSATRGTEKITPDVFENMLRRALDGIMDMGGAKSGDKTLVDTLEPAVNAFAQVGAAGGSFREALAASAVAAEQGKESTRGMIARVGRAARLGERSIGVLDAGAVSCCIILTTMFASVAERMDQEEQ